jgi:hypothetical protein
MHRSVRCLEVLAPNPASFTSGTVHQVGFIEGRAGPIACFGLTEKAIAKSRRRAIPSNISAREAEMQHISVGNRIILSMYNRRLFAELAGNPSCPSGFASANAIDASAPNDAHMALFSFVVCDTIC